LSRLGSIRRRRKLSRQHKNKLNSTGKSNKLRISSGKSKKRKKGHKGRQRGRLRPPESS
jgi:hypothetical protein